MKSLGPDLHRLGIEILKLRLCLLQIAEWIRRLTLDWQVVGSNPGERKYFSLSNMNVFIFNIKLIHIKSKEKVLNLQ